MKSKRTQVIVRRSAIAIVVSILCSLLFISVTSAQQDTWRGEYYNNRNLQGSPAHVRNDPTIFFDWNDGSPAPGVNNDNFSIRWSRTLNLPAGRYKFYVRTDDGSRLTVNNQRIINKWYAHAPETDSAEINLPGGNVPVVMEMFETVDNAEAHLYWERIGNATAATSWPTRAPVTAPTTNNNTFNGSGSTCGSNNWSGEFWNNSLLKGNANHRRTDRSINFNWANGSAAPNIINSDDWSARWTSMHNLAPGNYRLNVSADDGVVVYVNNKVVVNTWNQPRQRVNNPFYHEGGMVTMRVEYFDATGAANLNMWCQAFTPTQVPTRVWPTRTPVPQPTRVWPTRTPVPPPPAPTATPVPPTPTPDPRQTANAGQCQICKVYKLNVRSAPDYASAIVTVVANGEMTTYTGNRQGTWVEIRTNDGEIGWINNYYCGEDTVSTASIPAPAPVVQVQQQAHTVMVDVNALVIRACAGTNYDMRAVVYHGDNVELTGQRTNDNAWVSVRTATGVEGWAYAPYLWLTNADYNALQIVAPSCGTYATTTTTTTTSAPSKASNGHGTGTVNVNGLNLRAGPGFGYDIVAGAYYGESFLLYGTRSADNLWVSVWLANGQAAWAYAPYLNLSVPITNLAVP